MRDISPTGARAVFEARGEILTVPAEKGDVRNLTNTPGARWSAIRPGRPTARRSRTSPTNRANTRCTCATQNGLGEVKKISAGRQAGVLYRRRAGRRTARRSPTCDNHLHLWYIDLEQKKPVLVDTDLLTSTAAAI